MGSAAYIRLTLSSRDATETRDFPRARRLDRRYCAVAPTGKNLSGLHSRPRWDGEDFGFACRRRTTSHQGVVFGQCGPQFGFSVTSGSAQELTGSANPFMALVKF